MIGLSALRSGIGTLRLCGVNGGIWIGTIGGGGDAISRSGDVFDDRPDSGMMGRRSGILRGV